MRQENIEKVIDAIGSEYGITDKEVLEVVAIASLKSAGMALIKIAYTILEELVNDNDN